MATRRRTFGNTWWGKAWLDALEGRAVHDPNRLPVVAPTPARPGRRPRHRAGVGRAWVQGSRPDPYEVVLKVRPFRDDEWDCVFDAIAGKAAHAAALLDGELDPGVVADAEAVEVDLLPRSGELRTACNCPDWAEPCKHAAAVCYLVADALDDDPFVLLLLRGLDRTAVIDAIRARRARAGDAGEVAVAPEGVVAREAWRRTPDPLPEVPPPPRDGPLPPAPWPSAVPNGAPFSDEGLRLLAADAARRAWALRLGVGEETSGLDLSYEADLARHAAWAESSEQRHLADRAGVTHATLESSAAAWRVAGADGLAVLDEESWTPPVVEMVSAKERIEAAGTPRGTLQVRGNRITIGDQQYRLSRNGRWYLFLKQGGRWTLASAGSDDLDDLIDLTADLGSGGGSP
jgi:uncharacterized Zn finger protein